ncbi:hypothetical protein ACLKA6_015078 [Drosophila palustris]
MYAYLGDTTQSRYAVLESRIELQHFRILSPESGSAFEEDRNRDRNRNRAGAANAISSHCSETRGRLGISFVLRSCRFVCLGQRRAPMAKPINPVPVPVPVLIALIPVPVKAVEDSVTPA